MTRDVEWDDEERAKMQALVLYESEVCACGFHRSVADLDPDLELTQRRCPVCAGTAQAMRQIQAQDESAAAALGKKPPPEAELPGDGRSFGLRPKVSPEMRRLLAMVGRQDGRID